MALYPYPADWRESIDVVIEEVTKLVTGNVDKPRLVHAGWVLQGYLQGRFYPDGATLFSPSVPLLSDDVLAQELTSFRSQADGELKGVDWISMLKSLAVLLLRILLEDQIQQESLNAVLDLSAAKAYSSHGSHLEDLLCEARCAAVANLCAVISAQHCLEHGD